MHKIKTRVTMLSQVKSPIFISKHAIVLRRLYDRKIAEDLCSLLMEKQPKSFTYVHCFCQHVFFYASPIVLLQSDSQLLCESQERGRTASDALLTKNKHTWTCQHCAHKLLFCFTRGVYTANLHIWGRKLPNVK